MKTHRDAEQFGGKTMWISRERRRKGKEQTEYKRGSGTKVSPRDLPINGAVKAGQDFFP